MLLGAAIMIIGTVISVTAFGPGAPNGNVGGFVQFIVGRVITGVGNGMNTATIPSWVAETSKAHNRGFLICMEASTVAVGVSRRSERRGMADTSIRPLLRTGWTLGCPTLM
jgi:MFS family permease